MRKTLTIWFIFIVNICLGQQFNYTGYIYNAVDTGLSGVTVNLWTKLTVPYQITYPTYPTSISYNTGTVVSSSDDIVTGPYNIGFNFSFFGNTYTQFYICSNGWMGFTSGQTNGYTAAYIPNASTAKNVIMCDWEDLYPGTSNIYYTTTGTAPNRQLIVSFYNCPHYSCRTSYYTFQFVLYETTNIIDLNILLKPQCGTYLATQGLINSTNTIVVPVGGRNAAAWSVSTPQTVRFTPTTDTTWHIGKTVTTDATGLYTFNPSGFDINDYIFKVEVTTPTYPSMISSDYNGLADLIFRKVTANSKTYYQYDVNGANGFTVADLSSLYAKSSGIFSTLNPDYRLFNATDWNTIKISTTNLKSTIPGTQNMIIYPASNGGSSNYYCIKTGYKK
jgi:hypothetical protein